nr:PREDICTED: nuclear RNA export factor 1 [Lepisosteus oculatus]
MADEGRYYSAARWSHGPPVAQNSGQAEVSPQPLRSCALPRGPQAPGSGSLPTPLTLAVLSFQAQSLTGGHRGQSFRSFCLLLQIPYGKKYDKTWLITALQNLCTVPFTPVQYHCEGNKAMFYIEDATTANALSKVSRKITDTDGYKVSVIMNPSPPPPSIQSELKPEDLEHMKQCMSKRFDAPQQALDLNSIRTDPDLLSHNIEVILNRKNCMQAVNKIIEENIPELVSLNLSNNRLYKLDDMAELVGRVPTLKILNLSHNELKTERELDKIKGFKLEELWLDRNPLCNHFKDQSTYIRSVRRRAGAAGRGGGGVGFVQGGTSWPELVLFCAHWPTDTPTWGERGRRGGQATGWSGPTGRVLGSHGALLCLILHFLQQYYSVYDTADRQPLLDAYHDGASFSISIPNSSQNPSRSSLGDYLKDSRNIKRLKDPTMRFRLLKHTRLNVVAFLNELPKTQHDINCFVVDVNTYTNTLLSFTVSGVFKEVDGKSRDSVRAFSRAFIAVPAGNAGLCIVNDQLFVRNATTEEIRKAFATPAPTPSSSPVPTLSAAQQEMLNAFSLQSGMNLEWSQKCLQDNEWDFSRAAHIFTQLKAQDKIPPAAFMK